MARRIEVEVEGARAVFVLQEDIAPKTSAALWETLPIEGPLTHGKLSGDACYLTVHEKPLADLPEPAELGVCSIYKGFLVVYPMPSRGSAEMLISYGQAEFRWPTGRRYLTPVAEIEGDGQALYDKMRAAQIEGRKQIRISRLEG